jgi:hypothetical protein
MYCTQAGWCCSCLHFYCCSCLYSHTYFHSHFFPLLSFSYQEASNEWCCVFHLSCLDGLITSSCLRASIECVRQSVLQNPVFGHLQEVLIHLSESNQVNLPVLVLFDGCLFTCSRVVYTKQVARLFLFQPTNVTCSITITSLSNSSHCG